MKFFYLNTNYVFWHLSIQDASIWRKNARMDLDAFRLIGFVTEEMTAVMEVTNLTVSVRYGLTQTEFYSFYNDTVSEEICPFVSNLKKKDSKQSCRRDDAQFYFNILPQVALATNLTAEMANVSSNQRCVMACMTAATKKTKKIVQVQRAQVQLGQIQQVSGKNQIAE